MREIKFRAWDNESNEMVELYTIQPSEDYQYYTDNVDQYQRCKTSTLMQFTGLKDKNGKDIYEGDYITVTREESTIQGVVIWMDVSADYEVRLGGEFQCSFGMTGNGYEVIGNIYENPELLNQKEND